MYLSPFYPFKVGQRKIFGVLRSWHTRRPCQGGGGVDTELPSFRISSPVQGIGHYVDLQGISIAVGRWWGLLLSNFPLTREIQRTCRASIDGRTQCSFHLEAVRLRTSLQLRLAGCVEATKAKEELSPRWRGEVSNGNIPFCVTKHPTLHFFTIHSVMRIAWKVYLKDVQICIDRFTKSGRKHKSIRKDSGNSPSSS